jgi:hypothetical protein
VPSQVGAEDYDAKELAALSILNDSDAWMINPKNKFRLGWDLGVIVPLLIYLAIMMPFRLSFDNEAQRFSLVYWFEFFSDMVFIADIFLNFCTGTEINLVCVKSFVSLISNVPYRAHLIKQSHQATL